MVNKVKVTDTDRGMDMVTDMDMDSLISSHTRIPTRAIRMDMEGWKLMELLNGPRARAGNVLPSERGEEG
jgi:hypothetical protein